MSFQFTRANGGVKVTQINGSSIYDTHIINPGSVTIVTQIIPTGDTITISAPNFDQTFLASDVLLVNGAIPPTNVRALADLLRDNVFVEASARIVAAIGTIQTGGTRPVRFTFTQSSAATTWIINHNLGFYPNVITLDSAMNTILGNVTYVDSNNITVAFTVPTAGTAYLS